MLLSALPGKRRQTELIPELMASLPKPGACFAIAESYVDEIIIVAEDD